MCICALLCDKVHRRSRSLHVVVQVETLTPSCKRVCGTWEREVRVCAVVYSNIYVRGVTAVHVVSRLLEVLEQHMHFACSTG